MASSIVACLIDEVARCKPNLQTIAENTDLLKHVIALWKERDLLVHEVRVAFRPDPLCNFKADYTA